MFEMLKLKILILAAAVGAIGYSVHNNSKPEITASAKQAASSATKQVTDTVKKAVEPSVCVGNTLDKKVFVSVGKRHMWACEKSAQVYDTAVITGMEFLAADLTPRGTYSIYGKQLNQTLRGSDSTGSWNDFVYYWMPFLDNQYGTYGFHDATWRADNDFGNIDPNTKEASHGCIEMPLAAMKWLYGWMPIGATLTVGD